MKLAAHRGNRLHAPENSRESILSAYTAGADVIEFDLQITKDNELVLSHDGTTNRLTGEAGEIKNLTARKLRHTSSRYDFSKKFNPFDGSFKYYHGNRRMLIERFDMLADVLPKDIDYLIDLKTDTIRSNNVRNIFVEKTADIIITRGLVGNVVLYSRDVEILSLIRKQLPNIRIASFDSKASTHKQLELLNAVRADGMVSRLENFVKENGELTKFAGVFSDFAHENKLGVGAILYPKNGLFTKKQFSAVKKLGFVWSVSTDSLLNIVNRQYSIDVESLLENSWLWLDEKFNSKSINRDYISLGYAKKHRKQNNNANVFQDNGIHIETKEYIFDKPPINPSSIERKISDLESRMSYAEKSWPYYTGGGVGITRGITGDFIAEVDYGVKKPMEQSTTLEMAVLNVDPAKHRSGPPRSFRDKDSFFDPHGAPPYVGVEHDENDGYRINWNMGAEYDNNQYGAPVGDGKTPKRGRLRLERRGQYFSAYYKNSVDAPHWICVGVIRNDSLNNTVYLRCVAKRWRQKNPQGGSFPIVANTFTFKNLTIRKRYPK